jgi:DNA adenine methylase
MNGKTPHIVQYQGSKRLLSSQILQNMPQKFNRLVEPFSGMAAISIATAHANRAQYYHINDINEPVVKILQAATERPADLVDKYTKVWTSQFEYPGGHLEHYYFIRDKFNNGEQSAENMLYLLARCVKGAVRYGKNGCFNQSPDKRRHGTNPKNISENIYAVSSLLRKKTTFSALNYHEILDMAEPSDLVYMDPPYQGVSNTKDNRYFAGVDFDDFSTAIKSLDKRNINYIISYDGECGGREYGNELPKTIKCTKFLLNAGLSNVYLETLSSIK